MAVTPPRKRVREHSWQSPQTAQVPMDAVVIQLAQGPMDDVIQLVQAVKHRDQDTVNALLDSHEIDLNNIPGAALVDPGNTASEYSVLSNSGSILHTATSMCHRSRSDGPTRAEMEAILARLLGAGASPLAKDYHGLTPLHWACELG